VASEDVPGIGLRFPDPAIDVRNAGGGMRGVEIRFFMSTFGLEKRMSLYFGASSAFQTSTSAFESGHPGMKSGARLYLVRHRLFQSGHRLFKAEVRV